MRYMVHTVNDGDLPEGVEWLTVERDDAPPLMLLSGIPARVWAAMRDWEDSCEHPDVPSLLRPVAPALPAPRQPTEPSWLAS